jgi:hypothetical protein
METIYCKKVDLTILGKYRKEKIYDYCLYFSPTQDYSPVELEQRIIEKKKEIVKTLEETFKARVKIVVKAYSLERLRVKGKMEDMILTDKGCLSKKAFLMRI